MITLIDVLKSLEINARLFLAKTQSTIRSEEQEAILVDFINYVAAIQHFDFGMYTCDLHEDVEYADPLKYISGDEKAKLIESFKIRIERYSLFPVESIIRNKHMNKTRGVVNATASEIEAYLKEFIEFYGAE